MAKLNVGERVKFHPSHNKAVTLLGTVATLHKDGRSVDIDVEADGELVEVEHTQTAHVDECEVIADTKKKAASEKKESDKK